MNIARRHFLDAEHPNARASVQQHIFFFPPLYPGGSSSHKAKCTYATPLQEVSFSLRAA